MKMVEKIVVPDVDLKSGLNFVLPLDLPERQAPMTSRLNYKKSEESAAEFKISPDADKTVLEKPMKPQIADGVDASSDE